MKVRHDYVSNSSSSSFIVAVNPTYSISNFARDLAKNSVNPKSEYHDKSLKAKNQNILDFCLNSYELLFLGTWIFSTTESTMTLEKAIEIHGKEYGPSEFDDMKKAIMRDHENGVHASNGKQDYIDEEGTIHWFTDNVVTQVAVTSRQMSYDFDPHFLASDDVVFNQLQKFAEANVLMETSQLVCAELPEIYQITKNSIRNTRLLLKKNAKMEFEAWENLDSLEARLNKGEKIFAVRVNYQGGGYDAYAIYAEDDRENILEGIAAEELYGEAL